MARESIIVEGIETNKLAAPQVKGAIVTALALNKPKAIDALINHGLVSRKVLEEVAALDTKWKKILEPHFSKVPEKATSSGAGKKKPKAGEQKIYLIQNFNKKKQSPVRPTVLIPIDILAGSTEPGAKAIVHFSEKEITIKLSNSAE
jgi:hypothetical protein